MTADHYPDARWLDLTEDLFTYRVPDPYRWLEDAASEETLAWLRAQDELFTAYRDALPGVGRLAGRIRELTGAGHVGIPAWRGTRQFFTRRLPDQEHAVLRVAEAGEVTGMAAGAADPDAGRPLIDPVAIDPSGRTTLDGWHPDKEGRLLAYQLSEGGSEESVLRVMDVETGEQVDGPIDRCRYSRIAWLPGGKAFYYTRRLPPDAVPRGEEQYHRRVYLHRVGTSVQDDVLIFGEGRDKTTYYSAWVSRDGRWLAISAARGTQPRNDLWLADLTASSPSAPDLRVVQEGVDARTGARIGRDGRLYLLTDASAPRRRLAVTDPADPGPAAWRDLIPADPEAVLDGYAILDGQELPRPVLLALWTRHAISEITVHDLATGDRTGTVPLPGPGTVGGISERPEGGHEAWFSYTDSTTPTTIMHYDARTGAARLWARAPGSVPAPAVSARQVAYRSSDGTEVRMLVISGEPAGDMQAGAPGAPGGPPFPRPAILYGYGGFGISLTPAYSATILAWVEAGGVYAIAGLRGGSEEGEDWHRAGMLDRRQCVFDDFHAAAEKLIADGWTTPEQLGIYGGSNGGLLVGAAITQRPDLYAAAVCSAPLLDMVRYERFGLGETWNTEYGTAADPEQLGWLLSYSPYHHVTDGVEYPSVLFTVFDNDSRVDPVHARKMCAALQHATSASPGRRPILLRREADVGHSSRAVSRSVNLSADILAFLASHTGLSLAPPP
ncbi:MAG TPA: prolyl oligopeptidase family serine peptidase [Streptosporangiaceae bacterium]|jgi:prolyl oligopeptidase|nr:prolyl oligopeptidase family serine peptidase [Streptosporangiaceae bacterium]